MKKIYSLLMVSAIAVTVNAQVAFFENFSGFTSGDLGSQGSWTTTPGSPDVRITDTLPLTYPGYTSGSEYAVVSSDNGKDPRRTFSSVTTSTTTFYISFVVRISNAQQADDGPDYSIALFNTGDGDIPLRFYIAEEPAANSQIQFGISTGASGNAINWTSDQNAFAKGTTHLIVIRYDIAPGASNDDAYLWVNPSLASEPTIGSSNANLQDVTEADFGSIINAMGLFQSNNFDSPDAAYDGFRVAYGGTSSAAWTNLAPAGAPLPVQLTSFNASAESIGAKLIWHTAEESGIANYVIEKSTDGRSFTTIGTVKAANLRSYSYTDMQPASDNSYYRLKMVELDGTYKFSFIVSLKARLTNNIGLSPNPVKNILMIQHPKAGTAGHIQIISAGGQLLRDIRISANAVISNIDMSGFTNGLYHVVFRNGSDMFNKTVLKQ
jgi:hypothetical protein